MSSVDGIKTFYAGEALAAKCRVKIESGTVKDPPEVVYADAGEDHIGITEYAAADGDLVAVKLNNASGSMEAVCTIDSAIARGTSLYGAADGKVSDAASGSVMGIALQAGVSDDDIIEFQPWGVKSTTAASVSIADSGTFTLKATVEDALQELYQNAISVQGFIPIALTALRECTTSLAVGAITANGGVLASDTTPVLAPAVASPLDGCQVVYWAASNNDPVLFQTPLPPDLDDTADLVLHMRIKSAGTTNAVGFTSKAYFNEGDTVVEDTGQTNQTATWAEKTLTIAAADVPSGAQTLTCMLTPAAHTTDIMYLSALWLEYKTKIKTS